MQVWEGLLVALQAGWAPYFSNASPMETLLNAPEDKKDELMSKWRDNKLAELNVVAVTVMFILCIPLSKER
jgi:hypothetical protein